MTNTTYATHSAGNVQQPPHVNRPQPGPASPYPAPHAGPRIGQNRPAPFAQSSWPGAANQPTPAKRRQPVVLIVLLLVLTVAAGTFGTLYFTAMSDATSAEAAVAAKDKELRDAKTDEAVDKAATAESAKDSAEAKAQLLEACESASQELLTALRGDPNAPATQQAVATALGKMSISCV